jgi:hypothetical protein
MRFIRNAFLSALLLGVALGCEEDNLGFTGDFVLTVVESEDTCDNSRDSFQSELTISGTPDDLEVRFGDEAVLTGGLNSQNFFEVQGPATVVVDVDGEPVEVESFMVLIFEVTAQGRRVEVREGSMLTYEGTHPAAPGETCVQRFQGTGQRPSLAPLL